MTRALLVRAEAERGARVEEDFHAGTEMWTTVGASSNIIEASWRALSDSMEYALVKLAR